MSEFLMQRLNHRIERNGVTGTIECSCGFKEGPFVLMDQSLTSATAHCDSIQGYPMSDEDAERIAAVLCTADGHCPTCSRELAELMEELYPEHDWSKLVVQARAKR